MSEDWIAFRFGSRFWRFGPWYVKTYSLPYLKIKKPEKFFEVWY